MYHFFSFRIFAEKASFDPLFLFKYFFFPLSLCSGSGLGWGRDKASALIVSDCSSLFTHHGALCIWLCGADAAL